MIEYLPIIGLIVFCLFSQGFFSGSEIALVSINRLRLKHLAQKNSRSAKLVESGLQNPEWLLSTTLVGTNLSNFTSNTLATLLFVSIYGDKYSYLVILMMWPILLIFGEFIPKTLFQQKADILAMIVIYPLRFFGFILSPIIWLASSFCKVIMKIFGLYKQNDNRYLLTRQELKRVIEHSKRSGEVAELEQNMIQRFLIFAEKTVKEVMKPLVETTAIDKNADWQTVKETILKHSFTRFPVFQERVDNIVGILHTFDLLAKNKDKTPLNELIREACYVAENAPVDNVLLDLQSKGQSMAVVVDEYGGAVGILTVEDIVEEVVGEIEDEHEQYQPLYRKIADKSWLINGRLEIEQLEELLGFELPRKDFETLAGFLLSHMERIPKVGEEFNFRQVNFRIIKATARLIEEVRVKFK